jgi:hypothetical protein
MATKRDAEAMDPHELINNIKKRKTTGQGSPSIDLSFETSDLVSAQLEQAVA